MKKRALILITLFIGIVTNSCEQAPSLQQYFVEKMDDSSFLIVNLPLQIDSLLQEDTNDSEREVIANIGKLNLLLYKKNTNNSEKYFTEVERVKKILSAKRYQNLMDLKAFDMAQGNLLFDGKTDQIEEGIVFLDAKNMGFGVLRILGNDLNPAALISLSKKINTNQLKSKIKSSVESLGNFMESQEIIIQ
tara:strand:- start:1624 stop:2196 length:573 start_codon:yes stop_codon:yes gene_type:complete